MKSSCVILAFLLTVLPHSASGQDKPKPDEVIQYKQIDDVELTLHLFKPEGWEAGDRRPAIVFFFGGGWVGGTPSQFYGQSDYLASRGMVAICADYRTRSKHETTPRECVKDGKSAIRYVRAHADELGVDPERIAAAGGSAGGHVAAATATVTKEGFDESSDDLTISCQPNALVLFNPVYDNSANGYGNDRVKEYWEDFSPMHNLTKETPPTIVYLGTEDKLIPVATAEEYKRRMDANQTRSDLHLYEGMAHGFFNRGEAYQDTLRKTDEFLASLGYLEGEATLGDDD